MKQSNIALNIDVKQLNVILNKSKQLNNVLNIDKTIMYDYLLCPFVSYSK